MKITTTKTSKLLNAATAVKIANDLKIENLKLYGGIMKGKYEATPEVFHRLEQIPEPFLN